MRPAIPLQRQARREDPMRVPRPVAGEPGLVMVDTTWGTIAPMRLAAGVETVGERELIEHVEQGSALIDTRLESYHRAGTIPGAANIPHERIAESLGELDAGATTIFFCNGPQCTATPAAIRTLLDAGFRATAIRYYRGGIHDWVTLGLPLEVPAPR